MRNTECEHEQVNDEISRQIYDELDKQLDAQMMSELEKCQDEQSRRMDEELDRQVIPKIRTRYYFFVNYVLLTRAFFVAPISRTPFWAPDKLQRITLRGGSLSLTVYYRSVLICTAVPASRITE